MPRSRLKILGRRIHDLRRKRKMTQAQLAEKANLSTNFVGQIERGEAQATLESLFAIAKALGVNPSGLFTPFDRPVNKQELIDQIRELLDKLSDTSD